MLSANKDHFFLYSLFQYSLCLIFFPFFPICSCNTSSAMISVFNGHHFSYSRPSSFLCMMFSFFLMCFLVPMIVNAGPEEGVGYLPLLLWDLPTLFWLHLKLSLIFLVRLKQSFVILSLLLDQVHHPRTFRHSWPCLITIYSCWKSN